MSFFQELFLLRRGQLQDDYLPDEDSYFGFEIPKEYSDIFSRSELGVAHYLQVLKEKAFYLKFVEVEPTHKHILSIDNLTSVLAQIKRSYSSYVEDIFKKNFLNLYTNLSDLSKGIEKIKENLQLRVVDARIASFGIGLSVDTIMLSGDLKNEIREWSNTITSNYKDDVIDLDYENVDNVDFILKNYSAEARKKYFQTNLGYLFRYETTGLGL